MAVTQQTQACVHEPIAGMDVNEITALGTVRELKSMLRLYGKDEASIDAADDTEDVKATLIAMLVGREILLTRRGLISMRGSNFLTPVIELESLVTSCA